MKPAAILVALLIAGCGRHATVEPIKAVKTYPIVGVVREVLAKDGKLALKHEAIPGYMPAMTMALRVADSDLAMLEDLRVGDKISATLNVDEEHSRLSDIKVIEPAPPPELVLDPSSGSLTVRERPKKLEPGEDVPDFAVTTQDGSTLRLSELRGKAVALTFIYTRCPLPEFCPAMDKKFGELSQILAGSPGMPDKVRLLSISFDPEHDTPEILAKHATTRGAKTPLWRFSVMSHEELGKVGGRLGLTYGPTNDEILHNLATALIGPDGKLIAIYSGSRWTADEAFKAIRASLVK